MAWHSSLGLSEYDNKIVEETGILVGTRHLDISHRFLVIVMAYRMTRCFIVQPILAISTKSKDDRN
jgi:hypothetical protein